MPKQFTPREYQRLMIEWALDRPRCALWANMGTGKTVSALSVVDALRMAGDDAPALVLAPLRVARDTWPEEALKWDHTAEELSVIPIVGDEVSRRRALRMGANVYSTNYEQLPWLIEHLGESWPFRTVIADEATKLKGLRLSLQTSKKGKDFLRGQGGQRAKALGMIAHTKIDRFIELTGTPSPNGLKDLWGQLWYLDAGARLGRSYEAFKRRWFHKDYDGYNILPNDFAEKQIHAAIEDLCLTIDAKDWFDLREPISNTILVDLPAKARIHYREMEKEMFTHIDGRDAEVFNAAARTQKCLQLANGAVYVDPLADSDEHQSSREWRAVHDAKLDALEDIVEEANGMPVLTAYVFRSDLQRILSRFGKRAVDLSTRQGMQAFRAGGVAVGCGHPASMGHGVDGLQHVTNIVCHFGQDWNLEYYDQFNGRVGEVRQAQAGYDRPTFVHHIVARGTVDELVMERRASKRSTQDILLDAMKHYRKGNAL